jgi:hypothetical protein
MTPACRLLLIISGYLQKLQYSCHSVEAKKRLSIHCGDSGKATKRHAIHIGPVPQLKINSNACDACDAFH